MNKKFENNFLDELYFVIKRRDKSNKKNSYTKNLLMQGKNKIAQKIGEESIELIIDYLNGPKKKVIEETSDLLYHMMVLLYSKKISLKEIEKELKKRKKCMIKIIFLQKLLTKKFLVI